MDHTVHGSVQEAEEKILAEKQDLYRHIHEVLKTPSGEKLFKYFTSTHCWLAGEIAVDEVYHMLILCALHTRVDVMNNNKNRAFFMIVIF